MNVLYRHDQIFIPDRAPKTVSRPVDQCHRFCKRGVPVYCRIQLRTDGDGEIHVPFVLAVGDRLVRGVSDSQGVISAAVPPSATTGVLLLGEGKDCREYTLWFGALDPIDTVAGVQARLTNLGFPCGASEQLDVVTTEAIRNFQEYIHHPKPSGTLDEQTLTTLAHLHDEQE